MTPHLRVAPHLRGTVPPKAHLHRKKRPILGCSLWKEGRCFTSKGASYVAKGRTAEAKQHHHDTASLRPPVSSGSALPSLLGPDSTANANHEQGKEGGAQGRRVGRKLRAQVATLQSTGKQCLSAVAGSWCGTFLHSAAVSRTPCMESPHPRAAGGKHGGRPLLKPLHHPRLHRVYMQYLVLLYSHFRESTATAATVDHLVLSVKPCTKSVRELQPEPIAITAAAAAVFVPEAA